MALLGQQRATRAKPAAQPAAARRYARPLVAFWSSFTGQAIAAVALAHLALLPLFYVGMFSGLVYSLLALALSSAAIAVIGRRIARSVAGLRAALMRFHAGRDDPSRLLGGGKTEAESTELVSLQRGLENMYRRVAKREQRLKAAYEAAESESAASRTLAQQLARTQRIARIGNWEWVRASNSVVCSGEVFRILGVTATQIGLRPDAILRLVHADDRRSFKRWLVLLARGRALQGHDVRIGGPDGEQRHVHVLAEPLLSAAGTVTGVAGTIQDATERTRAIQQIHRLAYFDAITELPNRSRFDEKLAKTLDTARRDGTSFAIMYLDLDQFKRINDTLGHAVGDDLLRVIAQRLTRGLRPDDIAGPPHPQSLERDVCRHGGDEFIVLLNGVSSEQDAARAATRLLAMLAQPIILGTHEVFVSASIGIVLYPRDGAELDILLKNADVAMYHAKAQGRSRYFFYQDSMRAASAQRLSLEHDLRKALEGEQFELY